MSLIDDLKAANPALAKFSDEDLLNAAHKVMGGSLNDVADQLGYSAPSSSLGKEFYAGGNQYLAGMGNIGASMGIPGAAEYTERKKARAEALQGMSTAPHSWEEMKFGDPEKGVLPYIGQLAAGSAPYMAEAAGYTLADALSGGALTPAIVARYAPAAARLGISVPEFLGGQGLKAGATFAERRAALTAAEKSAPGLARTAMLPVVTYPSSLGDVLGNQQEEAGKYNLPQAMAAAVPYSALNILGLEGAVTHGAFPRLGIKGLEKSMAGRAVSGTLATGTSEAFNEAGQEVMNQYGRMGVNPNATLTDPGALERYKESAIGGAILGGLPGSLHAFGGHRAPLDTKSPADLTKRLPDNDYGSMVEASLGLKPGEAAAWTPEEQAANAAAQADAAQKKAEKDWLAGMYPTPRPPVGPTAFDQNADMYEQGYGFAPGSLTGAATAPVATAAGAKPKATANAARDAKTAAAGAIDPKLAQITATNVALRGHLPGDTAGKSERELRHAVRLLVGDPQTEEEAVATLKAKITALLSPAQGKGSTASRELAAEKHIQFLNSITGTPEAEQKTVDQWRDDIKAASKAAAIATAKASAKVGQEGKLPGEAVTVDPIALAAEKLKATDDQLAAAAAQVKAEGEQKVAPTAQAKPAPAAPVTTTAEAPAKPKTPAEVAAYKLAVAPRLTEGVKEEDLQALMLTRGKEALTDEGTEAPKTLAQLKKEEELGTGEVVGPKKGSLRAVAHKLGIRHSTLQGMVNRALAKVRENAAALGLDEDTAHEMLGLQSSHDIIDSGVRGTGTGGTYEGGQRVGVDEREEGVASAREEAAPETTTEEAPAVEGEEAAPAGEATAAGEDVAEAPKPAESAGRWVDHNNQPIAHADVQDAQEEYEAGRNDDEPTWDRLSPRLQLTWVRGYIAAYDLFPKAKEGPQRQQYLGRVRKGMMETTDETSDGTPAYRQAEKGPDVAARTGGGEQEVGGVSGADEKADTGGVPPAGTEGEAPAVAGKAGEGAKAEPVVKRKRKVAGGKAEAVSIGGEEKTAEELLAEWKPTDRKEFLEGIRQIGAALNDGDVVYNPDQEDITWTIRKRVSKWGTTFIKFESNYGPKGDFWWELKKGETEWKLLGDVGLTKGFVIDREGKATAALQAAEEEREQGTPQDFGYPAEPAPAAEEAHVTAARELLASVDAGGTPLFISQNMRNIAEGFGMFVTKKKTTNADDANALVERIRAAVARVDGTPTTEVAAPKAEPKAEPTPPAPTAEPAAEKPKKARKKAEPKPKKEKAAPAASDAAVRTLRLNRARRAWLDAFQQEPAVGRWDDLSKESQEEFIAANDDEQALADVVSIKLGDPNPGNLAKVLAEKKKEQEAIKTGEKAPALSPEERAKNKWDTLFKAASAIGSWDDLTTGGQQEFAALPANKQNVGGAVEVKQKDNRWKEIAPKSATLAAAPAATTEQVQAGVDNLSGPEKQKLADFYGTKVGTKKFIDRLAADVHKAVTQGIDKVAAAIRDIVKKVAAGVLSIGIVFNPMVFDQNDAKARPFAYDLPAAVSTSVTKEVRATVPTEYRAQMSPLAQKVYESMAPQAVESGKAFIIADKPNGMLFAFHADGSPMAKTSALYGKDTGDTLVGDSLVGGAKTTPAGQFTLEERRDKYTAEYTGGAIFALKETQDESGAEASVIAVHAVWLGEPSEQRQQRLESSSPADKRISFGCINTTSETFLKDLLPNSRELTGGPIFVLPDETGKTEAMFPAKTETTTTTSTPSNVDTPAADETGKLPGLPEKTRTPQRAAAVKRREKLKTLLDSGDYVFHAVRNDEDIAGIMESGLKYGSNLSYDRNGQAFEEEGATVLVFRKDDVGPRNKGYQNDGTVTKPGAKPVAIIKDTSLETRAEVTDKALDDEGEKLTAAWEENNKLLDAFARSAGVEKAPGDENAGQTMAMMFHRVSWQRRDERAAADRELRKKLGEYYDRSKQLFQESERIDKQLERHGDQVLAGATTGVTPQSVLARYEQHGIPTYDMPQSKFDEMSIRAEATPLTEGELTEQERGYYNFQMRVNGYPLKPHEQEFLGLMSGKRKWTPELRERFKEGAAGIRGSDYRYWGNNEAYKRVLLQDMANARQRKAAIGAIESKQKRDEEQARLGDARTQAANNGLKLVNTTGADYAKLLGITPEAFWKAAETGNRTVLRGMYDRAVALVSKRDAYNAAAKFDQMSAGAQAAPIDRLDKAWEELRALSGALNDAAMKSDTETDLHNRIPILGQFLNKQIPWYREQLANVERGMKEGWIKPEQGAAIIARNNKSIEKQLEKVDALRKEADALLGPQPKFDSATNPETGEVDTNPHTTPGFPHAKTPTTVAHATAKLKRLFFSPSRFDQKVTIVQRPEDLAHLGDEYVQAARGSAGFHRRTDNHVFLIADHIEKGGELSTFLHEVGVHAGMLKMIGLGKMSSLAEQIEGWAKRSDDSMKVRLAKEAMQRVEDAMVGYGPGATARNRREETIAYFVNALVDNGISPSAIKRGISKEHSALVNWFHEMWEAMKEGLRRMGLDRFDSLSPQDIVDLAYGAAHLHLHSDRSTQQYVRERLRQGDVDFQRAATLSGAVQSFAANKHVGKVHEFAQKHGLGMMITEDIADLAEASGFKEVRDYVNAAKQREGARTEFEAPASKVAELYNHLPESERGTGEGSVNRFIHDATMSGSTAGINRLSASGQALVKAVFQHGKDILALKKRLIEEVVGKEYNKRIAEETEDAKKDELRKERDLLLRKFSKLWTKGASDTYAPLKRFGDYVVSAKSAEYVQHEEGKTDADRKWIADNQSDPAHVQMHFADTLAEAQALEAKVKKEYDFKGGETYASAREADIHGSRDLFRAFPVLQTRLEAEYPMPDGKPSPMARLMRDMYLEALAENTARKNELRRRKITGASHDMVRAFVTQGRADAHFLANLQHNDAIEKAVQGMREGRKRDRAKLTPYLNEMLLRHAASYENHSNSAANRFKRVTSIWMLATNPAYYLQQVAQPWMMSLPVIAGRHGYWRTARALREGYTALGSVLKGTGLTGHIDWSQAPADVRDMLNTVSRNGAIDVTNSMDQGEWQMVDKGKAGAAWNRVDQKLRGLNTRVEAINRASTAIASYRLELARNKGDKVAATAYAEAMVRQTHGSYDGSNTPRYMQGKVAQVVSQFRRFQIIQISLIARLFHNAFRNADPKERAIGKRALAYTLLHTGAIGGALGMPGAALITSLVARLFGPSDEPPDFEKWAREAIDDQIISDLLLNGVPAMLGMNVSGKFGMGQMLSIAPFAEFPYDRKSFEKYAFAALGPVAGLAAKAVDGMAQTYAGNLEKAAELLLPSGLGNAMKGVRVGTQGVSLRKGDTVLSPDEIGVMDAILQGVGLPTTTITNQQRLSQTKYEFDTYYHDRAAGIIQDYQQARKAGESTADMTQEWRDLQEARVRNGYARQPLSTLIKSAQQQSKAERNTAGGVEFTKANKQFVQRQANL